MPIPLWKCKFCDVDYTRPDVAETCENLHRLLIKKKFGNHYALKIERLWDIGVLKERVDTRLDNIGKEIS